jgi:hypothetical protein
MQTLATDTLVRTFFANCSSVRGSNARPSDKLAANYFLLGDSQLPLRELIVSSPLTLRDVVTYS